MKAIIVPAVAIALCFNAGDIVAQTKNKSTAPKSKSEETIVIRKKGNGNTTVEIKNGEVYINGEKVAHANTGSNSNQKIIIENDEGRATMPFLDMDDIPRKAMLGVYTNTDDNVKGAEIREVMPGSAADEAGLRAGDIITSINNSPVKDGKELTELIAKQEPGDKVSITYERDGKEKSTEASLSKASPRTAMRSFRFNPREGNEFDIPNAMIPPFWMDAGDGFREPSPKLGAQVEDLADGKGVRILSVKPESPAEKTGLKKNDIIRKFDDEKISSIDDLQKLLSNTKRNEATQLQYERDGKTINTEIFFPKAKRKKDL